MTIYNPNPYLPVEQQTLTDYQMAFLEDHPLIDWWWAEPLAGRVWRLDVNLKHDGITDCISVLGKDLQQLYTRIQFFVIAAMTANTNQKEAL